MSDSREEHAALVGWTAQRVGDRLILRLQAVGSPTPHDSKDVRVKHLTMDRQQAVQLGNFLFEMFDESKPPKRTGWLSRFVGR